MDESANKGLESEGSGAKIPKSNHVLRWSARPRPAYLEEKDVDLNPSYAGSSHMFRWSARPRPAYLEEKDVDLNANYAGSSIISRMVVTGYDTSPPLNDSVVEMALKKHFASFGIKLIHASVPVDMHSLILCSHALIYVYEEFEADVLKLSGSDMGGGCVLEITAYPFDNDNSIHHVFAHLKYDYRQRTLSIQGFDTSLEEDAVEKMLREIIPLSSPIVVNDGVRCTALLHLRGQDYVDKALQLSGGSLLGSNIAVTEVLQKRPAPAGLCPARKVALG
ncbi:unnamed protein product [Eruca vesicaria subsp. sativa]|uniref:RRM domain-containing protein n=1 Tax=Eruca vesicaria subsp. sativa TaxID=29727 RepID=A0ABC8JYB4_ERUVS|nr:unnamed protein product [Eruca vesicaria subsp. sativa]